MKLFKLSLFIGSILLLTACQPELNPNTYNYYGGQGGQVQEGVIQDIQYNVKVQRNNGVGAFAGGVAGGAVGSNLGGSGGALGLLGAVGGAVLGGIAGNAAQNSLDTSSATLYIVQLTRSQRLVSVIQENALALCKGDHVYLINNGNRPRLILNNNYYSNGQQQRTGCSNNANNG
jgi:outer membrane lipoprotein SlyB